MITRLISIGNSKGIRIPKTLVQQYDLAETDIELHAEEDGILISPVKKARQNWEELFRKELKDTPANAKENIDVQNDFDKTEWTW
ncbi:MAG: AbrB/MazE/SpoVT family DNA-binding domain-containing protein [Parafilimonas sp.]